ncbi:MAG: hypothetical protein KF729_02265 [Sandaracinaceae bacterium]|nr:hypothetical protein [Sandaracinaceae bacterium]
MTGARDGGAASPGWPHYDAMYRVAAGLFPRASLEAAPERDARARADAAVRTPPKRARARGHA